MMNRERHVQYVSRNDSITSEKPPSSREWSERLDSLLSTVDYTLALTMTDRLIIRAIKQCTVCDESTAPPQPRPASVGAPDAAVPERPSQQNIPPGSTVCGCDEWSWMLLVFAYYYLGI
jgi:hypothetical protein